MGCGPRGGEGELGKTFSCATVLTFSLPSQPVQERYEAQKEAAEGGDD